MHLYKKFFSGLIILSLLLTLIPITDIYTFVPESVIHAEELSGSCGSNAVWQLDATGEKDDEGKSFYRLTISGSGKMSNKTSYNPICKKYKDHITDIVIEKGITYIGEWSFCTYGCLESVSISDTVTNIGKYSFYGCTSLSSVKLSDKLTTVGDSAFGMCAIRAIDLPETLVSIGDAAFNGCRLSKVMIPKNVSSIGNGAFTGAIDFKSIRVEEGNEHFTVIDNILYKLKNGKPDILLTYAQGAIPSDSTLTIPESVTTIEAVALYGCRYRRIIMPDNLTNISFETMSSSMVEELVLPDNLEYLGLSAFSHCKRLKKVTIGKKLRSIGGAFDDCPNLKNIIIDKSNPYIRLEDNVVYNSDKTSIQLYLCGKTDPQYTMPDTVTNIEHMAISNNTYLKRIVMSKNIKTFSTTFNSYCKSGYAKNSIASNPNLIAIYFNGNAPDEYMADAIKDNNSRLIIYYPENATGYTGSQWSGYQLIEKKKALTSSDYKGTIGNSISWEYSGSTGVLHLSGSGSTPNYDTNNSAPWNRNGNVNIYEVETEGITGLGDNIFYNSPYLVRITSDDSIKTLGKGAFANCPKLTYAELYNVVQFGDYAFSSCTALTSFTLNNSVKIISEGMFSYCTSLNSIIIPKSVTRIEAYAFQGCKALEPVSIPASVEYLGSKAFYNDFKPYNVYFFGGIPDIEPDCFPSNNGLSFHYCLNHPEWTAQGDTYMGHYLVPTIVQFGENTDHYSFPNTAESFGYNPGYRIPKNRYLTLLNHTKTRYYLSINSVWHGSCFGMAGTALEFYENPNEFKPSDYTPGSKNLYDVFAPKDANAALTELIELYDIAWFTASMSGCMGQISQNLNDYSSIISMIEEFEQTRSVSQNTDGSPIIMIIYSPYRGHAVIPVSVEPANGGSYNVKVYDPDYPDSFKTLKINKDMNSITYGIYTKATYISYKALHDVIANPKKTRKTQDNSLYISINKDSGTVNDSYKNALSDIDNAYEQLPISGNTDTDNNPYRSFVVSGGNYLVGKSTAMKGNKDNSDQQPLSIITASDTPLQGSAVYTPAPASAATGNNTNTIYRSGRLKYTVKSEQKRTATVYGATKKNIKSINIPAKVTLNGKTYKVVSIRAKAFQGMKKLKAVVIGKNIIEIGKRAFANCTGIKHIIRKSKNIIERKDAWKGVAASK